MAVFCVYSVGVGKISSTSILYATCLKIGESSKCATK